MRLLILLIPILLFSEIKTIFTSNTPIFFAKKINDNLYYERRLKCNIKNMFVYNRNDIYICDDYNKIKVLKYRNNQRLKKIILKGKYKASKLYKNKIYILLNNKVYVLDKNLEIKKIVKDKKINDLIIYKNDIYYISFLTFKSLTSKKIIKFPLNLVNVRKFKFQRGKLFAYINYFISKLKNFYVIKNIDDNYQIELDTPIKDFKFDGKYLYVLDYNGNLYKYIKKQLVFKEKVGDIIDFFIKDKKVYLFYPYKVAIIEENKCIKLNKKPILISFNHPAFLTKTHNLLVFNQNLDLVLKKKVFEKINSIKVYGNEVILIGTKLAKLWVAKIKNNKLIQKTFFDSGNGFDVVKIGNGYVGVGYKVFDFLGKTIKRFVIFKLDKNLNLVDNKTYGNYSSYGLRIFRLKNKLLVVLKMKYIFFAIFDKNLNLIFLKKTKFKTFYNGNLLNNSLYFIVDKKEGYEYNIEKNKIYKISNEDIDFILSTTQFIKNNSINSYLIENNKRYELPFVIENIGKNYVLLRIKNSYSICNDFDIILNKKGSE